MRLIPILATPWVPDSNPFGPPSIFAVTLVACLVVATSRLVSVTPRAQRWLVAVTLPVFLSISAVTEGSPVYYIWWHSWSFPNLDDFVAAWLYLVVGFICALRCLRYPEAGLQIFGALFSFVFGSLIIAKVVMILWGFPLVFFGGWDVDWTPVLVALVIFAVAWASFVWFRFRRRTPQLESDRAT